MTIAHWDDVEPRRLGTGPLGLDRYDLGTAAGSKLVGLTRARVDPGKQSSPVHVEGDEEEIFYVLGGFATSWQDGTTYEVRPGDCLVHLAGEEAHTLVAGPEGLDVLAFGERTSPTHTYLPRAGIVRMGITLDVSTGPHPWEREAAAGDLELPPPAPRPASIVNLADVDPEEREGDTVGRRRRDLGRAAGSDRTGLKHYETLPGKLATPPHCHSAEEEIFVVLDGEATLLVGRIEPLDYWDGEA